MGLALKCLEHVTAIGCGLAAFSLGSLDPGLTALGVVSGAALLAQFKEHCAKHGLDEPELLSKMQMAVLREWDTVDQTQADRDAITEADTAMRLYLPDCMMSREDLAASSISKEHYPKRAARLVADQLGKRDASFAASPNPEDEQSIQRRFAMTVIEQALKTAMDEPAYAARLMLDLVVAGNAAHAVTHERLEVLIENAARTLELVEAGALGTRVRASRINRRALVVLARRINLEVDEEAQALAELTDAIERLLALEANAALGTNYETLVDQALKRMTDKAMQGDFDGAADEGRKAFATWEERQEAQRQSGIALIEGNIQQQVLRGDASGVVDWVLRRLALEFPDKTLHFEELNFETNRWLDKGRRNGSQFDLRIAIEASSKLELISKDKNELARAQNLSGISIWRLGEIQSGTESLYLAIRSFDESIENRPRSETPLEWVKSQISKAGVWFRIGHRDDTSDGLIQAATCSRLALEEATPENSPFEWAAAHNNLGNALFIRGERISNLALIRDAIDHFKQSLRVRTKKAYEASWSMTMMNLGCAYSALGDLVDPKLHHQQAVFAIEEAISVRNRTNAPYDWARAASNLGVALCRLGVANRCVQTLNRSLSIQAAALDERPKDKVPMEWSNSAIELAWVKFRISELEQDFVGIEETIELAREGIMIAEAGGFKSQAQDGMKLEKLIFDTQSLLS
jgi:tetratricopeptide (TPR) repeat protein